jgi:hypothetical protein
MLTVVGNFIINLPINTHIYPLLNETKFPSTDSVYSVMRRILISLQFWAEGFGFLIEFLCITREIPFARYFIGPTKGYFLFLVEKFKYLLILNLRTSMVI